MADTVVLDASVLHPMPLCDTLLRLCDAGFFRAVWTGTILDEMANSLRRRGLAPESIVRRRRLMEREFAEAMEPGAGRFLSVVPEEVHPKDRHVVAAAIAARADIVVTLNLRDFPRVPLLPFGIAVQHPDEFLVDQLRLSRASVIEILNEQASELRTPPMSVLDLVRHLEAAAPVFAASMRDLLRGGSDETS